jgi:hypothetical protein
MKAHLPPSIYLLAVLLFAMPFAEVSCVGNHRQFTGLEIARGQKIEGKWVEGSELAALAFMLGLCAVGVGFVSKDSGGTAAIGTAATLCLLAMPTNLNSRAAREMESLGSIAMIGGYYPCLLAFAGTSTWLWFQHFKPRPAPALPPILRS